MATYTGATIGQLDFTEKKAAYRFGRQLGMAFQMIDDLLDYTQTTATLNKPVLEDLHNGIVTLPLIYAYQNVPEQLAPLVGTAAKIAANSDRIAAIVSEHGLPQARQLATLIRLSTPSRHCLMRALSKNYASSLSNYCDEIIDRLNFIYAYPFWQKNKYRRIKFG